MVSLVLSICGCLDNNTDNEDEKDKNKKPVADVSNTQSLGFKNDPVSFQGVGHDPDGTIVLFEWDFDGDGVYDWKSNKTGITTYEYNNPGLYHASLKVTDNDGAVDIDYIEKIKLTDYIIKKCENSFLFILW